MSSFLTLRYDVSVDVYHAALVINDVQAAGGIQYEKNIALL